MMREGALQWDPGTTTKPSSSEDLTGHEACSVAVPVHLAFRFFTVFMSAMASTLTMSGQVHLSCVRRP